MTLGGIRVDRHLDHADDARLPADAGADLQPITGLELHDLGEVGSERIADETTGLGQDLVEILAPQRQLTELREHLLLPYEHIASILAFVAYVPFAPFVRPVHRILSMATTIALVDAPDEEHTTLRGSENIRSGGPPAKRRPTGALRSGCALRFPDDEAMTEAHPEKLLAATGPSTLTLHS